MPTLLKRAFLLLCLMPLVWVAQDTAAQETDGQASQASAEADDKSDLEERKASNLEQLLQLIEDRQLHWSRINQRREQEFSRRKSEQDRLLREAKAERLRLERISEQLEATFQENEAVLGELQSRLNERLGTLRELFGVLQQVAGDTQGVFETSVVSAQLPGRTEWLETFAGRMGISTELATIEEMENLWVLLQQEMTATGQVAKFRTVVTQTNGSQQETDVIRVGAFNLIDEDGYLNYSSATGNVLALPRQPASRFAGTVGDFFDAGAGEVVPFAVDPTRGSLLGLLIQSKTLVERIEDGGYVGAVIIFIGIIGILLAVYQFIYLAGVDKKVQTQLKSETPNMDNPLGRVLQVGLDNRDANVETLELRLSEAILAETPKLSRFLPIVQVISVVSPLLGLLGTVIGMILTFQAITLFGTGDPQTMAGGISTALMTTVLGLCAAIPTVLLHAIVNSRSKTLIHVLEEQSTGVVAERSEKSGRPLD